MIDMLTPLLDQIKKFIDHNQEECKLPRLPLNNYIKIFEKLGYEKSDYDANGYQVDFWMYFKKDLHVIVLSGDLWYAEEFTLRVDEE